MSQIQWLAGQAGAMKDEVVIINISVDLPYALKRYREEKGIDNAIFLSDHFDTSFGKNWGLLLEEIRLLARGLFIVDEDGIIRYTQVSHDDLFNKSLNYEEIAITFDEMNLFK